MGLWGAAQAIGFAVGGVLGTAASDLARLLLGSQVAGYSTVFTAEAVLFVVSAWLAGRTHRHADAVAFAFAFAQPQP